MVDKIFERQTTTMSEMREKLLDTAEEFVRLRGYHAVSFRDLADATGIRSATVHYYFQQKEDLGVAMVRRYAERFFSALEDRIKPGADPLELIRTFCQLYRKALIDSDKICLCGMLGAESCGLPEDVSAAAAEFLQANADWLKKALPASMPATEKRQLAAHILATLQGAMIVATSLSDHKVFDDATKDLMSAVSDRLAG